MHSRVLSTLNAEAAYGAQVEAALPGYGLVPARPNRASSDRRSILPAPEVLRTSLICLVLILRFQVRNTTVIVRVIVDEDRAEGASVVILFTHRLPPASFE
jgi:hypothetical protein